MRTYIYSRIRLSVLAPNRTIGDYREAQSAANIDERVANIPRASIRHHGPKLRAAAGASGEQSRPDHGRGHFHDGLRGLLCAVTILGERCDSGEDWSG